MCRVPRQRGDDAQQGVARRSRAEYDATEFAEVGNAVFGNDAGSDIGPFQGRHLSKELEHEEQRYWKLRLIAGHISEIGQLQALVDREIACPQPADHRAEYRRPDQRYGFRHVKKDPRSHSYDCHLEACASFPASLYAEWPVGHATFDWTRQNLRRLRRCPLTLTYGPPKPRARSSIKELEHWCSHSSIEGRGWS